MWIVTVDKDDKPAISGKWPDAEGLPGRKQWPSKQGNPFINKVNAETIFNYIIMVYGFNPATTKVEAV